MHICIDESGTFANPKGKDMTVSGIAALLIPEPFQKYIFKGFKHLKRSWGLAREEPKERRLDERQVAQVVTVLGRMEWVGCQTTDGS